MENDSTMKTVTLTKPQYDDIVYPAVALHSPGDTIALLRICDAVMTKLEDAGQRGRILDKSQWGIGVDKAPPPLYKLNGIAHDFEFENAEAEWLVQKLIDLLPTTQGRLMRDALPIIDALEAPDKKEKN